MVEEVADPLQPEGFAKGVGARIAFELAQEIAAEDVKRLLFVGPEGRGDEADPGRGRHPISSQRAESGAVLGHLLAVEVDCQAEGFVDGAHIGLPRLGNEPVLVLGGGGQGLDFPRAIAVRVVGHIALEVGIDRAVFPALIQPTKHVAIVAVAQAHVVGPPAVFRHILHLELAAEQAGCGAPGEALRAPVLDVEHGTHAVAVLGLEAPRGEADGLDHVGVGKGQAFLLAGADQEGAIDLDAVDVDEVFVEAAAPDVVGAGELTGEVDRGLNQQVLDRATNARDAGRHAGVDPLNGAGSGAVGFHLGLVERDTSTEPHVQSSALRCGNRFARDRVKPDEGEADGHLPWVAERQVVAAVGIGDSGGAAALGQDGGSGERASRHVGHPSKDAVLLGVHGEGQQETQAQEGNGAHVQGNGIEGEVLRGVSACGTLRFAGR